MQIAKLTDTIEVISKAIEICTVHPNNESSLTLFDNHNVLIENQHIIKALIEQKDKYLQLLRFKYDIDLVM